jgi:RNA polymerase sigma-70 factor (ECF subfamily)
MAHQTAADAMVAKLGQFRGEKRFTTWAHKFVIFEVSTKLGRHFWRRSGEIWRRPYAGRWTRC